MAKLGRLHTDCIAALLPLLLCVLLPPSPGFAQDGPQPEAGPASAELAPGEAEASAAAADSGNIFEVPTESSVRRFASDEERLRLELAANPSARLYVELITLLEAEEPADAELAALRLRETDKLWRELLQTFPEHPDTLLANGQRLFARGSLSAALQSFSRGAEMASRDPRFPHELGRLREAAGDLPAAIAHYEAAARLSPEPQYLYSLALALGRSGQSDRAYKVWSDAVAREPEEPLLRLEYGLALQNSAQYEAALEQYERGKRLDPKDDRFYNRSGLCLLRLERFPEAVAQVEQAIRLRPDPLYYANIAYACEELSEDRQAQLWYLAGLEQFPEDSLLLDRYISFLWRGDPAAALARLWELAQARQNLTLILRVAALAGGQRDYRLQEDACRRAIELAPQSSLAALEYARLLARQRRYEELTGLLSSARGSLSAGGYSSLIEGLTNHWIESRELRVGETYMEQFIADNPRESAAYSGLAALQLAGDNYRKALDTVIRGQNDSEPTYFARYLEVLLTARVHGPEQALPLARALSEGSDADEELFLLWIELLDKAGHEEEIAAVAAIGLSLFPVSGKLLGLQAEALLDMGEGEMLIKLLSEPRYLAADYPRRSALLGRAYLLQGSYVRAAGHFISALEAEPGNAELWAGLGESRLMQGEIAAAREALTQSLALNDGLAAAHLWLGHALIAEGDSAGAAIAFSDSAACAPLETWEMAWIALGIAKLSQLTGDKDKAELAYSEARAFGLGDPRLDAELRILARELGKE